MIFQLEICAFNIGSCITAQQSGAHRIELCDNPSDGGTTPSYGLIQSAVERLHIDIYPIIRPRGGDFFYNDDEYSVMKKDIQLCKDLGCKGIVIGMLNIDGSVDKRRLAVLVELAYPMGVTFHRAFDWAVDAFQALEDIINIGCERILTSGQRPAVMEGVQLIKELVERADERIIIMPGSGLRSNNIQELALQTGAVEFHTTAKKIMRSEMKFINDDMKETLDQIMCDGEEVKKIMNSLVDL
jgi:copper homeostasis protein